MVYYLILTIFGKPIHISLMTRAKHILSAVTGLLLITIQATAQISQIINVPRPGTLPEMITGEEAKGITHLIVQGKLNAIDFRYLRDSLKSLRVLDLSLASISRYVGKNGTDNGHLCRYPAHCIPAYAFCRQACDNDSDKYVPLRHIILPQETNSIGEDAFKGCDNLKICQIRRNTPPDLKPGALADSLTAIFVPAGSIDAYRSNKQWKRFAFLEGEPVSQMVRISPRSSLARELQRKGIQPKDINSLTIRGKLDEADFKLIRDFMPNLVSVDLSHSDATIIPDYTFTQKKNLLRISLPQGLKVIGQRAFSGCNRLSGTLLLPPEVTAIEYGAFIGCIRLHRVVATGDKITTLGDKLFGEEGNKLLIPAHDEHTQP